MIIWIATQNEDAECYNILGKTKKEILTKINDLPWNKYNSVYKLNVDVSSVYNLIDNLTNEGGGRNEYMGNILSSYFVNYGQEKYNDYKNPRLSKA